MAMNVTESLVMPDGEEYKFIGLQYYGFCSTSASTQDKEVDIIGFSDSSYNDPIVIYVMFANENTHSEPYLNVNDTTSFPIMKVDGDGTWSAWQNIPTLAPVELMFMGDCWLSLHPIYDGTVITNANGVNF